MASNRDKKDADNLAAVLEKIPQMFGEDAAVGLRLHDIVMAANPALKPRLWYGMPGYARGRSKPVLVFIRRDDYLTFGVTEKANLPVEEGRAGPAHGELLVHGRAGRSD